MLSDDRNLQEVKEKLTAAEEAFLKFKDAHLNYTRKLEVRRMKLNVTSISPVKRESSEISTGRLVAG